MNYIKGRRYEYKWKEKFEKQGYIVLRTAGSHGFADLILIHKEKPEILFVQIKTSIKLQNFKLLYEREKNKLPEWVRPYFVLIAGIKDGKNYKWEVYKDDKSQMV